MRQKCPEFPNILDWIRFMNKSHSLGERLTEASRNKNIMKRMIYLFQIFIRRKGVELEVSFHHRNLKKQQNSKNQSILPN